MCRSVLFAFSMLICARKHSVCVERFTKLNKTHPGGYHRFPKNLVQKRRRSGQKAVKAPLVFAVDIVNVRGTRHHYYMWWRADYGTCPHGKFRGPECLCREGSGMAKSTSFPCRIGQSAHQGVRRRPEKRANPSPQGNKARRAARGARFWEILYIFSKARAHKNTAPSTKMRTSTNLSGAFTGLPALRENTNSAERTRTARATPPVNQLCCHRTLTASRLPGAGPSTEWCPEVISQNLAREGARMAAESPCDTTIPAGTLGH